ncbi:MAG TPA: nucleotidyltransferase domain-containing protein [Negativicutes bacterium]|nr:MAG: hypothetical protein A3A12_00955 [Candidatus Staskawiczbacteria bacterium RIFCSPLOWO2_01_FULL_43_17b]HLD70319.1 nucleotidyltransferase domain-containing protein [Negativicutes bacterium]
MTNEEIEKLLPIFEKHPTVKLVYLFGSRASGKVGPLSDYDFAVYLDEKDALKRFDIRIAIAGDLSGLLRTDAVDVVVINDTDQPELKFNIIHGGKLILEREPFKVVVEPQILMEYFDFHELLLRHHLTKS